MGMCKVQSIESAGMDAVCSHQHHECAFGSGKRFWFEGNQPMGLTLLRLMRLNPNAVHHLEEHKTPWMWRVELVTVYTYVSLSHPEHLLPMQ